MSGVSRSFGLQCSLQMARLEVLMRDGKSAQEGIDIDCYEEERAEEYGQQYEEVGQIVASLLFLAKLCNRFGHHVTPLLNNYRSQ